MNEEVKLGRRDELIGQYGPFERNKYRAVIFDLLPRHFGKENVDA